ncbi:type II toxin-antitoxin system RelE/ParE family toxin [Asticcacaulis sp. BYS171W]|uniref:Type II toxin-antitoxin system RelE/ParE family toxin n=1 Tax=Asticcacaulis aquaticus TaxID=2984212 RepID=A0ABT5HQ79_9CAUL|nr:type II toxin-antitoxin system RelE/ParE family toxin [Asticcacaulis aquaticus]MDC7682227.1 type II toxin-antitoxin system RelE/ParE family toxin [Asticcacaulis aquaticus]
MSYCLTETARDDIDRLLFDGMTRFGLRQAESYYRNLVERFEFLSNNPRAAPERKDVEPHVHVHPFVSHVIIYKIDGDDIVILSIRNARENWHDLNWLL